MGSTLVARRAGMKLARAATAARVSAAIAMVMGSWEPTPYRNDFTIRVAASAAGMPMAEPAITRIDDSRMTSHTTDDRDAPSATRIPISRVRRVTA